MIFFLLMPVVAVQRRLYGLIKRQFAGSPHLRDSFFRGFPQYPTPTLPARISRNYTPGYGQDEGTNSRKNHSQSIS